MSGLAPMHLLFFFFFARMRGQYSFRVTKIFCKATTGYGLSLILLSLFTITMIEVREFCKNRYKRYEMWLKETSEKMSSDYVRTAREDVLQLI